MGRLAAAVATTLAALAVAVGCTPSTDERAASRTATTAATVAASPTTTTTAAAPSTTTTVPPCPDLAGAGGQVTVFRREAGGACVPPGQLVGYRCSDASAPVVVTDAAGTPTDHLGGRFAQPIAEPPAGARLLGVRDDGARLLASPADPGAVFVDGGRSVTRWPALPGWTTASGVVVHGFHRPHAFFLGDSVMLGAVDAITRAMAPWDVVVDAEESRSTLGGVEVVRRRRAEIADVLVVQLGANDGFDTASYAERVRGVLDQVRDVALVVWLTVREVRPEYEATNAALRDVVAGYPNAMVADWHAVAPASGVYADGLHLRAEGATAMAALARDTVFLWHLGTVHRGPDGCRADVLAAARRGG